MEKCTGHANIVEDIKEVKQDIKSAEIRISALERESSANTEKFITLFNAIERIETTLNKMLAKLEKIAGKSGEWWDKLLAIILSAGVGGAIGYIITNALKGGIK